MMKRNETGKETFLIVDDMEVNRVILSGLFETDYRILTAENGEEAIKILAENREAISLVLLDIMMPVMDGYSVLTEMKKRDMLDKVPVIVITSSDKPEDELKCLENGASDLISKPFIPFVIKRRIFNVLEQFRYKNKLEHMVNLQTQRLLKANETMMDTLSTIIEHRNMESGQHILRIRGYTEVLLEEIVKLYPEYALSKETIKLIASASRLHDIGKIMIPDAILNKPGRLTKEEFEVMKSHAMRGYEILGRFDRIGREDYFTYAEDICRHHHERIDGKGYPDGLKGDNISIAAQAVGLADCYDALTTERVYKPAFSHITALTMICNGECGQFSEKLLKAFRNVSSSVEELARKYADGVVLVNEELSDISEIELKVQKSLLGEENRASKDIKNEISIDVLLQMVLSQNCHMILDIDLETGTYTMKKFGDVFNARMNFTGAYEADIDFLINNVVLAEDRENMRKFASLDVLRNMYRENKRDSRCIVRMRGKEEEICFCENFFYAVPDENRVFYTITDVTDQKNVLIGNMGEELNRTQIERESLQQVVKEQRLYLEKMIQSAVCGLLQIRIRGEEQKLINMNKAAAEILGFESTEEFYAKAPAEIINFISEEDREYIKGKYQELKEIGDMITFKVNVDLVLAGGKKQITGRADLITNLDKERVLQCSFIQLDK